MNTPGNPDTPIPFPNTPYTQRGLNTPVNAAFTPNHDAQNRSMLSPTYDSVRSPHTYQGNIYSPIYQQN